MFSSIVYIIVMEHGDSGHRSPFGERLLPLLPGGLSADFFQLFLMQGLPQLLSHNKANILVSEFSVGLGKDLMELLLHFFLFLCSILLSIIAKHTDIDSKGLLINILYVQLCSILLENPMYKSQMYFLYK